MMTMSWTFLVVLTLVLSLSNLAQAGHGIFPSTHGKQRAASTSGQQQEGVSVDLKVLDAEQAKDIFDADVVGKGVQPLLITIHNTSHQTYHFSKGNVDANYIPAAIAARAAYENPVVVGGRMVKRVLGVIPGWLMQSDKHTSSRPILNQEIQRSVVKEEIPDRDIGPNGSLAGFMYVHRLASAKALSVRLINVQTQESLFFHLVGPGTSG